jgi:hypothetical protein
MAKKSSKRPSHLTLRSCLQSATPILASLVFLHALISAPLLVQCIGADGRGLIEVLGNDPCHTLRLPDTTGPAKGAATSGLATSGSGTDPCRDLLLENPGCNASHVETAAATPRAADSASPARLTCAEGRDSGPMGNRGRLQRILPPLHPRDVVILRI